MPKPRPEARLQARRLRAEGMSVRTISRTVGAAQSSVSLWVRDVPVPAHLREALDGQNPVLNQRQLGQRVWSRMCREVRAGAQENGRVRAREGDPLHLAGCMLYWAEGSKSRNAVTFTNADPAMVRYFMRFLRECYSVKDDDVRLTVNCFLGNGLALEEIEAWWLTLTELPWSSLCASVVNVPSSASKRVRRPLRHGTARVQIFSTEIVQSIYGAIQEYAAFDQPEWLGAPGAAVERPGAVALPTSDRAASRRQGEEAADL